MFVLYRKLCTNNVLCDTILLDTNKNSDRLEY